MALSIFAAAAESPGHAALVVGGRTLSYQELAAGAREAVRWLRDRGLDEAPLVALLARNELATIEMLHALIALGVPALPIHPRLTAAERAEVLARSPAAPLVDADWRDAAARSDLTAAAPLDRVPDPAPPPDDERPMAILQTSGTAGRPRGVVLSRAAFVASATASAANLGWQPDDRWLLRLPIAHVGGLSILTRCLLARRTVVLEPAGDERALATAIEDHRVTLISLVPTLLSRLLELQPRWDPPPRLRAILLGGAAASPALLSRAADRGWPVLTTYGMSETCSQVTTQPYGTTNRGELGSGPSLPGAELRIADSGEIQVRGPMLFSGYLATDPDRPDASPTGHHEREPPLVDGGWFATGDRGRIDERGNLHVLGRRSDRIISGGENVDPLEVEQALERLPGVRAACVFGLPDEEWGEVVCAAVATGPEFDRASARSQLGRDLAGFKRPRRLALLDALPTDRTGKVDREATARLAKGRLERL